MSRLHRRLLGIIQDPQSTQVMQPLKVLSRAQNLGLDMMRKSVLGDRFQGLLPGRYHLKVTCLTLFASDPHRHLTAVLSIFHPLRRTL